MVLCDEGGMILLFRRYLGMFGDISGCHGLGMVVLLSTSG